MPSLFSLTCSTRTDFTFEMGALAWPACNSMCRTTLVCQASHPSPGRALYSGGGLLIITSCVCFAEQQEQLRYGGMSQTPCMFLPVSSVCCWHTFGCEHSICCISVWNLPVLKDSNCDHIGVQGVSAGRICWTADYSGLGYSIALACEVAHNMLRDSVQHVRLLLSCVPGTQGTSAAVLNALAFGPPQILHVAVLAAALPGCIKCCRFCCGSLFLYLYTDL